jgi:mannose-1-phosphate guanylyltransferase
MARKLCSTTRDRAALAIPQSNTVIVVNRQHQHFYQPLTRGISDECLIEQTANRGTTPAILHAAIKIERKFGRNAIATIFPSNHYVDKDRALMRHVEISARAVKQHPELMVVLGIAAILRVRRFWEEPASSHAEKLWLGGCFWNSFVFTVKIGFLLDLIKMHLADLYSEFLSVIDTVGSRYEEAAAARVYSRISSSSFSGEIMTKSTRHLAVRPVNDLEWSDLGEPRRVYRTLKSAGWNPPWLKEFRERRVHLDAPQLPVLRAS